MPIRYIKSRKSYSAKRRSNKSMKRVVITTRRKRGLLNGGKVYKFSRWAGSKLALPLLTTPEVSQSYSVRLNDIQNYTEFAQLFDQYMITGVAFYIRLITNPDNNVPLNQTTTYPTLWSVIDYDDDSVLSLSMIREKQGCKKIIMKPNKVIKRYIPYPRVSAEVYRSGTSTGYAVARPMWVDCNSIDAPHYGLKLVVDAEGQNTESYNIQIERKFYFKLKGVQ